MEYIVNERGERTHVILTMDEYERLAEATGDAEHLKVAREELAKLRAGETKRERRT